MAAVSRARSGSSFTARLAVAVLLASCLASALVAAMANRLAEGAVQRETVERVASAASAVTARLDLADRASAPTDAASTDRAPGALARPPGSDAVTGDRNQTRDLAQSGDQNLTGALTGYLAGLAAEPDVLGLLVVDHRGQLLLAEPGSLAAAARTPDDSAGTRSLLAAVARDGRSSVTTGRAGSGVGMLTVAVPLRLPGRAAALQVELVAGPVAERADQLWRALGVALMLGVGATVALVFATGGTSLVRRHERALRAAGSDDLTGLGSRRAFRRDLRLQVAHAARHRLPLTLALIDVNGLEQVNGTVGRRRGDALLVGVGSVLQRAAELVGRPVPAYRIGGDAFALIMPGTAQDDAFTLTDTLRRHIGLDAAPLTANVGLSVLDPQRCPDPETLLIAADAALFEARSLGGNRVVGAGDGGTGLRWVATSGVHDRLTA